MTTSAPTTSTTATTAAPAGGLAALAHLTLTVLHHAYSGPPPAPALAQYNVLTVLRAALGDHLAVAGDHAVALLGCKDLWDGPLPLLDLRVAGDNEAETLRHIAAALRLRPQDVAISPLRRGKARGNRLHLQVRPFPASSRPTGPLSLDLAVELVPRHEAQVMAAPLWAPGYIAPPAQVQVVTPEVLVAEAAERLVREYRRDRGSGTGADGKYVRPRHVAPVARILPLLDGQALFFPLDRPRLVLALHRTFLRRGTPMPRRLPPIRSYERFRNRLDQLQYERIGNGQAAGRSMFSTYGALRRVVDPALARMGMLRRVGQKLSKERRGQPEPESSSGPVVVPQTCITIGSGDSGVTKVS